MANRYDDEFGRDREQRGRWERENDRGYWEGRETGYGREGSSGREFGREGPGEGWRGSYGRSYGSQYGQSSRSQFDRGEYAAGESEREYGGQGRGGWMEGSRWSEGAHGGRSYGEGSYGSRDFNERASRGYGGGGTQTQTGQFGSRRGEYGEGFGGSMGPSYGGYGAGVSGGYGAYGGGMGGYYGVGRHTGKGPKGYRRSDERIKEDINERLTQHGDLDASDVDVQVREGEVTLTGSVDERHCKRIAEDIAESISGVKDVHNQIRVRQGESATLGIGSATPAAETRKR